MAPFPANEVKWPRDPWTVVMLEGDDTPYLPRYYAFNTRTGERKPDQATYDQALETIPV